jgi:site-specific DNA-methyltransferase (adenine-specific)
VSAPADLQPASGCTLHLGDCRGVLRDYPPAMFDLVLADPPYGETALEWDEHVDGWLDACRRVMKPSASLWCFGSMAFFMERAGRLPRLDSGQDVVWEKHLGPASRPTASSVSTSTRSSSIRA